MNESKFTILSPDELESIIQSSITKAINQLPVIQPKPEVEFFSRIETSQKLKISLPTLWKVTKSGALNAYKINKRVLYRSDDINIFLRKMNFITK